MERIDNTTGNYLIRADRVRDDWGRYDHLERRAYRQFQEWSDSFLTKSNDGLGRSGHVCPFTRAGLEVHQSIYLSCSKASAEGGKPAIADAAAQLDQARDWFEELVPRNSTEANFGAVVILFPQLEGESGDRFMLDLHGALKSGFVKRQVMIGEFFANCKGEGIHNSEFRPLQSPVPLFVIRYMNVLDLPFLTACPKQLESYRERFQIGSRKDLSDRLATARVRQLPRDWDRFADKLFG